MPPEKGWWDEQGTGSRPGLRKSRACPRPALGASFSRLRQSRFHAPPASTLARPPFLRSPLLSGLSAGRRCLFRNISRRLRWRSLFHRHLEIPPLSLLQAGLEAAPGIFDPHGHFRRHRRRFCRTAGSGDPRRRIQPAATTTTAPSTRRRNRASAIKSAPAGGVGGPGPVRPGTITGAYGFARPDMGGETYWRCCRFQLFLGSHGFSIPPSVA